MKMLKKLTALLLVAVMALMLGACHKKNETAVTIDGFKFTSAYYLCALINADSEAKTKAQEIAEKDDKIDTSKEDYYYSVKIDKKDYKTWVKDRALEMIKEIAAYKVKCKEAKLEIDEQTKASAEYYAQAYWSSYGYAQLFEPNGVSFDTYKAYMLDASYSSLYFDHLYAEGGEKEIKKDDLSKQMTENYALVDMIQVNYSELSDEEKTTKKTALEASAEELKSKKKDFETVYYEYNEKQEEAEQSTEEEKPQDKLATIVGKSETNYAFAKIDDVMKMAQNEVKFFDDTDSSTYYVIVKKDISADPYYLKNMDATLRNDIKGDEFKADIEKFAKTLKADVKKSAVNQFDVKDLIYPQNNAQA